MRCLENFKNETSRDFALEDNMALVVRWVLDNDYVSRDVNFGGELLGHEAKEVLGEILGLWF
jgi:hypothetical protein